ncbi:uncharacterized protein LOC134183590 [Corticium candelabrum]|uniref:uncharacterized protein LOC134183590 n=1 Tax=Corticium candelabrum TaxID=121492 RepID=UPI002E266F3A|nr:uncharacterized protein LOC134183590 [Corticium candelabrum]
MHSGPLNRIVAVSYYKMLSRSSVSLRLFFCKINLLNQTKHMQICLSKKNEVSVLNHCRVHGHSDSYRCVAAGRAVFRGTLKNVSEGVASRLSGYCWGSRCYRSNAHARMTFLNKFVNVIRAANVGIMTYSRYQFLSTTLLQPPEALSRRPKKPMGAFQLYFKEVYHDVMRRYPGMMMAELIQVAAEEYGSLDDIIREAYKEESRYAMDEHKKAMQVYKDHITVEDKKSLAAWQDKKRKARQKRAERAERKALQTPKGPTRPFVLFANEYRKQCQLAGSLQHMAATQSVKEAAAVWKEMADEEKQVYKEKFENDRQRYNKEMIAFKRIHNHSRDKSLSDSKAQDLSAFDMFVEEQLESGSINSEGKLRSQILNEAFRLWKALSPADHERYTNFGKAARMHMRRHATGLSVN